MKGARTLVAQLNIVTQRRIFDGNFVRKHDKISLYSREAEKIVLL